MKKGFLLSLIAMLLFVIITGESKAQNNVGIGTNAPDPWSLVDMVSNSTGLLIPRLDSNSRKAIPLAAVRQGLVVYDKDYDCFFYYSLSAGDWVSLCPSTVNTGTVSSTIGGCNISTDLTIGSPGVTSGLVSVTDSCGVITGTNSAWITKGNYNTSAGTNYIGTNDAQDFVFKTGGTANINERMRMLLTGQITVNRTTPLGGYVFSSYATAGINNGLGDTAITGYSTGSRVGVYGHSTGGDGVLGRSSTNGSGVFGISTGNATGVKAFNTSSGFGLDVRNTGTGTAATVTSAQSHGITTSVSGSASGIPLWATNYNNNATAIASSGGVGLPTWILGVGTGGAFNGKTYGVYGYAWSGNVAGTTAGGYFRDSLSAVHDIQVQVASRQGGTNYKITGNVGTVAVSGAVADLEGKGRIMFASESPELLFEDYGVGQLTNGSAYIQLDEILAKNVTIDERHPMKVFIQLEGDCNGVYVTEKSASGFVVKELNSGTSNVKFSWHIVANVADYVVNGEVVSKHADLRFPYIPADSFPKNAKALYPASTNVGTPSNNNNTNTR